MGLSKKQRGMMEKWIKWEPIKGLSPKYYIESISDNINGFEIILFEGHDNKEKVHVIFENSVDAYNCSEEGFRLKTIWNLGDKYGKDFYGDWTFFKVINSKYLQWLSKESVEMYDSLSLIHFSFLAADSVLDVVTTYEPRVEIIKSK